MQAPRTATALDAVDPRTPLDRRHARNNSGGRDLSALDAVGVIAPIDPDAGRVYAFGSGYLIDSCHVLTAEHVMYGWRGDYDAPPPLGQAVQFAVGQMERGESSRTEGLRLYYRGVVSAHGGSGRHDGRSDHPEADWALVTLSSEVTTITPLTLRAVDPTDHSTSNWILRNDGDVGAAGFPGDHMDADPSRAHGVLWGSYGTVMRVRFDPISGRGWLSSTNAATAGTSGGPLFVPMDGREVAVGIVQSVFGDGIHDKDEAPTLSVLITPALLDEIEREVRRSPCGPASPH